MKYGAIDIGTNAARLLIGEISPSNKHEIVKKISYTRIPLRLGYDVFENGEISPRKEKEFLKTIQAFKLISEVFDVKELRACATSAMREAENGKDIQKRIKKATGVDIEIIGGKEEGDLIISSFELLDFDHRSPFIVIDVGGGSTEISMFNRGKKVNSRSFNVGTIRLLKNKVKKGVWEDINEYIKDNFHMTKKAKVFATGGNINKIHKLFGLQYMQPIYTDQLMDFHDEVKPLSISKRIEKYQLKEDRADVIVPAMEIYTKVLKKMSCGRVYVPKIGLSDGIIYDLHKKNSKK
ncbi:MAG: exopolyphosphatase [Crocinitomicaceae bacterium]|nr:ethanolamine ammonia-lyase reactivating factor EutA [Crocinitomicaceae bacterium]